MPIKVTQKIKNAFTAHGHVHEIWVASNGEFYIHEPKDVSAYVHVKREDVDFSDAPAKEEEKQISDEDKALVALIAESGSKEEASELAPVGVSEVVAEAAKKKIEELEAAEQKIESKSGGSKSKK